MRKNVSKRKCVEFVTKGLVGMPVKELVVIPALFVVTVKYVALDMNRCRGGMC